MADGGAEQVEQTKLEAEDEAGCGRSFRWSRHGGSLDTEQGTSRNVRNIKNICLADCPTKETE